MYDFLNLFFYVFHSVLIIFNLSGWIWKKTRELHFYSISLTALSWFGLGLFYGWGYCPCTGWHWQIRRNAGITDMPSSYIKFLLDQLTGLEFSSFLVDLVTVILFFTVLIIAVVLKARHRPGW
ncbi:MAG: DUF2784 domain-containing protein [Calditrichaceae bacterium]